MYDDLCFQLGKFNVSYVQYLVGGIGAESEGVVHGFGYLVHILPVRLAHLPITFGVKPDLGIEAVVLEAGHIIAMVGIPTHGVDGWI